MANRTFPSHLPFVFLRTNVLQQKSTTARQARRIFIASVFNTLGAIPGNVVFFLIVSALGNGLNFALNLLSCYVHDLRLQCLEYFGKFYQDGGKPFEPLAINTKYVDIQS